MTVVSSALPNSTDVCGNCGQRVTGEHLTAMNKKWHMVRIYLNISFANINYRITLSAQIVKVRYLATFMSTKSNLSANRVLRPSTFVISADCRSVENITLEEASCYMLLV